MRLALAVVRPSAGRQHGKPKLKILRVRVEMLGAGEDSSRGRTAHFHSIRVETAAFLGCDVETVKSHLKRIRERAAEVPGIPPPATSSEDDEPASGRATRIAAYLHDHPGEVQAAGALFGFPPTPKG